jgi:hypothetical protein
MDVLRGREAAGAGDGGEAKGRLALESGFVFLEAPGRVLLVVRHSMVSST